MKPQLMTPKHKDWNEFCDLLSGEGYCNFRKKEGSKDWMWDCKNDHRFSREILAKHWPTIDLEKTMIYFKANGACCCDCEILFNIHRGDQHENPLG